MKEIRHILIPTDFSEAANNSLDYAVQLAKSGMVAKIVVLHSYQLPVTTYAPETTVPATYVPDQAYLMDEVQNKAEEEMKELEVKYLQPSGIPYECLIKVGSTMDNLNDTVTEYEIDLVVMATQKASKLERLLGDLTAYALEKCQAPLLLVPDDTVFRPVQRIAFATDLKKIIRAEVFDKLKYLALAFRAHIVVLNVNTDIKELSEEETIELNHIKHELQGMEYHFQFIDGEDAEQAILDYVHKQEIDLVAAVPRHHGFFEGLFKSSVTRKIALHTRVPLLAIHE